MASQQFAAIAVLIALSFLALAVSACANSEQTVYGPAIIAPDAGEFGVAEFHGASIGEDALRSRLRSE